MAWTDLGKQRMFETWFEGSSAPTKFWLMAAASDTGTWDATLTNTSAVTLLSGTGYPASGYAVERDGVDFTVSAGSGNNWAQASLRSGYQLSASTGGLSNIHYFLLTDNNPDENAREIFAFWSTGSDVDIGEGNTLSITAAALRGT